MEGRVFQVAAVEKLQKTISDAVHDREVPSSAPGAMAAPLAALRMKLKEDY